MGLSGAGGWWSGSTGLRGPGLRPALAAALGLTLLLAQTPLHAQLKDGAVISTEGTQFVPKPPPPPAPQAVQPPPPPAAPAPPTPAAPQAAPASTPARPPRYPTVIFLVDTSDSMLTKVQGSNMTRIDEAKSALERVIRGMSPETRVQLWIFNTSMSPVRIGSIPQGEFVPMSDPALRDELIGKLHEIRTAGGTNLYHSIVRALGFFGDPRDQELYRSGQRFPVLVVISDGEDSGLTRETMDTVQAVKAKMPLVTINTIGFTVTDGSGWFEQLCRIATDPHGCATAENREQLHNILESFYKFRGR